VGLRDVAEAVGVTAGLVTHYFGTYAALVREVLKRQNALTRAKVRRLLAAHRGVPSADELIGVLFEALSDERRVRLFVWAQMQGELRHSSTHGLRDLVDSLESALKETLPSDQVPARARIEIVTLLALSAVHGYAVGKHAWLRGLGLGAPNSAHDDAFREALTAMLRSYMAAP
jgi:AcrR family transcriptional regulator